ncbi:MAG: 3D-(3,5/4)-trihydroxycyclohexane-1,2-dione acylhydrolase (decyclizing) [Anaerolineales bacterium]|nr:3D-(3,5/4)-trihydroxycyclohexane-1,2-dione acylhydrolase (decyclizing) [Anaerolineales bacterium]
MSTIRLTMAQAIIKFLKAQYIERDGVEQAFFAGCFGIFGHGNVAGIGQALQQNPDFRYYQTRNEQAMVHTAAAFAKVSRRMRTFACTTSIGPGATNMVTGAAAATINHLPVLLLPGDIFARRNVAPVLQQLELPGSQDISVNDCLKPVSRYWDRLNRPEQAITSLLEAMRVLTSQVETGAVTLALPQDVQAEAFDYPSALFEKRVWRVPRLRPDSAAVRRATELIRASRAPLIVAGGGVIFSDATAALRVFVEQTGIPVGETQAGKGSLPYNHPACLGAIGVTGTRGANLMAREADLVIGIGTTYDDFTTSSKTAFQNPSVRFINLNLSELDALKHNALPVLGDARAALEELTEALAGWQVDPAYRARAQQFNEEWDREVERIYSLEHGPLLSQGEVIGAVNAASGPRDIVLCAAGSLPGDLHKLWRTRDEFGYHLEYGYSCMGYEIAGGLGAKMAAPDREVYVMVGDGSYLMMAQEIVTAVQEGIKLIIILINNHGFASIGGLSESLGSGGFGTRYLARNPATGQLDGDRLPVDLAANARSLGAHVIEAKTLTDLRLALETAKRQTRTTVIYVETDPKQRVGGYESWWDVPVAAVAEMDSVQAAYRAYTEARKKERYFL